MSEAFEKYRSLKQRLIHVRWIHRGLESDEEDRLIEDMDTVWWQLDTDEQDMFRTEPPQSLIRSDSEAEDQGYTVDVDVNSLPGSSPRCSKKVA